MTALYTEFAVVPPESCYNASIRAAQKQPARPPPRTTIHNS
ncbi:hypothetical protein [Kingella denitrificans]